jgi:hypothetical protein
VGWWEKESGYVASVWDMQNATEIGSVSADVTGTSVLIGAVAPIPIITPVRRKACDQLSQQLRSFLEGSDMGPAGATVTAGATGGGAVTETKPDTSAGGVTETKVDASTGHTGSL